MTVKSRNNIVSNIEYESQKLAGITFFILGAGFITIMMLAAAIVSGYNFKASAISDLGITPSTSILFNLGLIFAGIFNIVGGILFYTEHKNKNILSTFLLAGLGAIGTGIFPLDTGDIHSLFALLAFLFFNIQAISSIPLFESVMIKLISTFLGILGLVFVVIMFIGDSGNPEIFGVIGHGGAERLIVYPADLVNACRRVSHRLFRGLLISYYVIFR